MPLVLANFDDFGKIITKPLHRKHLRGSAHLASEGEERGGRQMQLVLANIGTFAKTIEKPLDREHFAIIGRE